MFIIDGIVVGVYCILIIILRRLRYWSVVKLLLLLIVVSILLKIKELPKIGSVKRVNYKIIRPYFDWSYKFMINKMMNKESEAIIPLKKKDIVNIFQTISLYQKYWNQYNFYSKKIFILEDSVDLSNLQIREYMLENFNKLYNNWKVKWILNPLNLTSIYDMNDLVRLEILSNNLMWLDLNCVKLESGFVNLDELEVDTKERIISFNVIRNRYDKTYIQFFDVIDSSRRRSRHIFVIEDPKFKVKLVIPKDQLIDEIVSIRQINCKTQEIKLNWISQPIDYGTYLYSFNISDNKMLKFGETNSADLVSSINFLVEEGLVNNSVNLQESKISFFVMELKVPFSRYGYCKKDYNCNLGDKEKVGIQGSPYYDGGYWYSIPIEGKNKYWNLVKVLGVVELLEIVEENRDNIRYSEINQVEVVDKIKLKRELKKTYIDLLLR